MKDIKFTVCLFVCLFVSVCRGRSSSETAENLHKDQGLSNSVSSPTCVLQSPISTAIGPMRPARGAKSFFLGRQCFFFWQPWLPKKCPSVDLKALRNNALFQKQFIGELFRDRPKHFWTAFLNPLESRGNYNATSNNMKLVHWPLMGGLLHLIQRGGDWAGPQPAQAPSRCTKCYIPLINGQCTNHRIAI